MDSDLLARVRAHYVDSGDFNGLALVGPQDPLTCLEAVRLLDEGLVEVVTEADYLNPHIRPWPTRRSRALQRRDLEELTSGNSALCLYPTAQAMSEVDIPQDLATKPFNVDMFRGRGTLEVAFFRFDVLEQYRNDPRYWFEFHDAGVGMGIADVPYLDGDEPEHDKVSLSHIGFGYEERAFTEGGSQVPIVRYAAVFYGDLKKLSIEHQQRWKTYQADSAGLLPHPRWWMNMMGEWGDGLGPFERLLCEIENISAAWTNIYGSPPLFRTHDRPRELGWLLRATQRDWDEFTLTLDKLLSENLDHKALDTARVPRERGGERLGSLVRLQLYLESHGVLPATSREVLEPLRTVRRERQGPAHKVTENVSNAALTRDQVILMESLNGSLFEIRSWLSTHPKNRDFAMPHANEDMGKYYRV